MSKISESLSKRITPGGGLQLSISCDMNMGGRVQKRGGNVGGTPSASVEYMVSPLGLNNTELHAFSCPVQQDTAQPMTFRKKR